MMQSNVTPLNSSTFKNSYEIVNPDAGIKNSELFPLSEIVQVLLFLIINLLLQVRLNEEITILFEYSQITLNVF